MPQIEAICSLIKDNGHVIGISLVPSEQAEAHTFCALFCELLADYESSVSTLGTQLIFFVPSMGLCCFDAPEEDLDALEHLLSGEAGLLEQHPDGSSGSGFKVVLFGMKDVGEKIPLPLSV